MTTALLAPLACPKKEPAHRLQPAAGVDNTPTVKKELVMNESTITARAPQPTTVCTVPWCTGCTWREDGDGWSRLHRVVIDGLVEVFAGESSHAHEGTGHAPASVIVLGVPDELETPENTRDLASALTKAARIQARHGAVAR